MTPAIKSAILAIIAAMLTRLALWTTVTIDTFRVVAVKFVVARRHTSYFSQYLPLVVADRIVMSVGAVTSCTVFDALQVVHIA